MSNQEYHFIFSTKHSYTYVYETIIPWIEQRGFRLVLPIETENEFFIQGSHSNDYPEGLGFFSKPDDKFLVDLALKFL